MLEHLRSQRFTEMVIYCDNEKGWICGFVMLTSKVLMIKNVEIINGLPQS